MLLLVKSCEYLRALGKKKVMKIDAAFTARVVKIIEHENPKFDAVKVRDLTRTFGGNARLAWSFELDYQQDGQALTKPCILLSQVAGGHVDSDTEAEYGVLKALTGKGVCTPAAIALDAGGHITQAPAIIMERVEGDANAVVFLNDASGDSIQLSQKLANITADLHQCDWKATGLPVSENPVLTQINEWEVTFLQNRAEPHPVMMHLFRWMKSNAPEPSKLSLVHGDLRPGNFLYQGSEITALLDWEMAHIGDPAEDICWIYRDLWSPEKFLSLSDFVGIYQARHGLNLGQKNILFYRIFSEIKFATISLTASTSVALGKSSNMRHADRAAKVPRCLQLCFEFIDQYNQLKKQEIGDAIT